MLSVIIIIIHVQSVLYRSTQIVRLCDKIGDPVDPVGPALAGEIGEYERGLTFDRHSSTQTKLSNTPD